MYADCTLTIQRGEHLSGWIRDGLFQGLSFYQPDLNLNPIYYGDWKYDTVHHRTTEYVDEYGEVVTEPGAGPQASFFDDLRAAIVTVGRHVTTGYHVSTVGPNQIVVIPI